LNLVSQHNKNQRRRNNKKYWQKYLNNSNNKMLGAATNTQHNTKNLAPSIMTLMLILSVAIKPFILSVVASSMLHL